MNKFKELREELEKHWSTFCSEDWYHSDHRIIEEKEKRDLILAALEIAEGVDNLKQSLPNIKKMHPLEPEYAELVSKHFWKLLA